MSDPKPRRTSSGVRCRRLPTGGGLLLWLGLWLTMFVKGREVEQRAKASGCSEARYLDSQMVT
ncbi:hypothetical protein ZHAS_00010543 [Anopheles sinensis]|uniref:Uncharacterized protein n=1 Tax=Anopheles sinensis TaxID=74873 RepID=A0A084VXV0_ANOSI|nr:hypothetical protein ZHAS_00010543 [Anopheles sinensis]